MTTHTFTRSAEGNLFIENNRTLDYTTSIEVTAVCKAFSAEKRKDYRVLIGADKTVSVWDSIAGHFTSCHALSRKSQLAIIRKHIK